MTNLITGANILSRNLLYETDEKNLKNSTYDLTIDDDFVVTERDGRHTDVVNLLIEHGASVNFKNSEGNTPMHKAVKGGHIKCTTILLNAGVNPRIKNDEEKNPVDLAREEGHLEVINFLEGNIN